MKKRIIIILGLILITLFAYYSITTYIHQYDFIISDIITNELSKTHPHILITKKKTPNKILIVQSYNYTNNFSQQKFGGLIKYLLDNNLIDKKFKDGLIKTKEYKNYYLFDKFEITQLWLEAKQNSTPEEIIDNLKNTIEKIKEYQPDILILIDDDAIKYIGTYFYKTNIPIIFSGLNTSPLKYNFIKNINEPGENITGVYQYEFVFENINFYQKIICKEKINAVYISDNSQTAQSKIQFINDNEKFYKNKVNFINKIITNNINEIKKAVIKYNNKSDVDVFIYGIAGSIKDSVGRLLTTHEVIKLTADLTKKPVLANSMTQIEAGALITITEDKEKQGILIGQQLKKLIEGNCPTQISILTDNDGIKVINAAAAKKFNLDIEKIKENEPKLVIFDK